MRICWVLLISLLSLALGSCGGSSQAAVEQSTDLAPLNSQEISTEETSSDLPESPLHLTSTPESTEMSSNPSVEKYIALSKQDLADRLQIDSSKIITIEATKILWPDAALGCPSVGKVYAQGRVPGYRIRFEVEGTEYIYHTDLNGQVVLCPEQDSRNSSNSLPPSGPTPHIGVPID